MNLFRKTNNKQKLEGIDYFNSFIGFVIICVLLNYLMISEKQYVKECVTYDFVNKNYVKTATDYIEPEKDGKLVFFSGMIDVQDIIADPKFNVIATNSMSLIRDVEMFQWTERSQVYTRTYRGKTEKLYTTYEYEKKWSSSYHDTNLFNDKGYKNPIPKYISYRSCKTIAKDIKIGAHIIPSRDIAYLGSPVKVPINSSMVTMPVSAIIKGNQIFYNVYKEEKAKQAKEIYEKNKSKAEAKGEDFNLLLNLDEFHVDLNKPEVGDVRITFTRHPVLVASVLAQQKEDTIVPYNGEFQKIYEIKTGEIKLLNKARSIKSNAALYIIFYFPMCFGFFLLFNYNRRIGCLHHLLIPFVLFYGIIALFWLPHRFIYGLKSLVRMLFACFLLFIVTLISKMLKHCFNKDNYSKNKEL